MIKKYKEFLNEWHDNDNPPEDNRRYTEPDSIEGPWSVLAEDGEYALVQDENNEKYMLFINPDKNVFADYAEREITSEEDEDGWSDSYSDEFEIDVDVLERWLNATEDLKIGEGLTDWESGDYDLVKLNDELKNEIETLLTSYRNKKSIKILNLL